MRYIQTKTETNSNRINQKSYLTKFSGFTTIRNMMFVRTGRMLCITYICKNIEFTVYETLIPTIDGNTLEATFVAVSE